MLAGHLARCAQMARVLVHRFHQGRDMFRRGELADAMAQIEDVRGACGGCIGVRLAKTVQHPNHFLLNLRRRRKQHIGIDVAL